MYYLTAQNIIGTPCPATKAVDSFVRVEGGIMHPRTKGDDNTICRRSRTMG